MPHEAMDCQLSAACSSWGAKRMPVKSNVAITRVSAIFSLSRGAVSVPGLTAMLLLASCAAPFTWQHPGLGAVLADRQREIDSAECTVIAMQSIPLPNLPAVQGPTTVNVNVDGYGQTTTAGSVGDQALQGAEAAQLNQSSYQAQRARVELANACMLRRGWVRVKSGQQPNFALPPTAELQTSGAGNSAQPPGPNSEATAQPSVPVDKPLQRYDAWQAGHGN